MSFLKLPTLIPIHVIASVSNVESITVRPNLHAV